MRRRDPRLFAAAAGVFVLAVAYLIYGGIQQGASYWVTVAELRQRAAAGAASRVRLGGTVKAGTVTWDRSHQHLRFAVTDGTQAVRVEYTGVVPDIFAEGRQVVVEGAIRPDGVFAASTLLAKCPTKYNAAEAETR